MKNPYLLAIGITAAGTDNVPRTKIPIFNAPDANTISAAEHTIALIFSLAKNIPTLHFSMQNGKFLKDTTQNFLLQNHTAGIIGFGRIGSRVGEILRALGMKILAYDPFLPPKIHENLKNSGVRFVSLPQILKKSDFLTLHVPLNDTTRRMIGAQELAMMKNSAFLVNAARGGVVDENALFTALEAYEICGAALDTHEFEHGDFEKFSPLRALKNVILTPHVGAATRESKISAAKTIAKKLQKFLKNCDARS